MNDKKKDKGGRPRILKPSEKWVYRTFNLTPSEAKKFDLLCRDKRRIELFLDMMEAYEEKVG